MALRVASQIVGLDVADVSFVNIAWRDVSSGDEVSELLRGIGIDLIVVGGQAHSRVVSARSRWFSVVAYSALTALEWV